MLEQNRKPSFPIVMLLVSVALWIASLSNVAFYLGNHESMKGLTVLILGSIFTSLDIRYCAAYANYVWLAAIVFWHCGRRSCLSMRHFGAWRWWPSV